MTVSIRELDFANALDRDALAKMIQSFSADEAIGGKGIASETAVAAVAGLARRVPSIWVAMAWDESGESRRGAGMVITIESYSTFAAAPVLNIHDVAVASDYRRQGVGRRLVEAARDEARRRDCCKMTLEAYRQNEGAIRLYRDLGFRSPGEGTPTGETLFFSLSLTD